MLLTVVDLLLPLKGVVGLFAFVFLKELLFIDRCYLLNGFKGKVSAI